MTSPSSAPAVSEVIDGFLAVFPEVHDPDWVRDRCQLYSNALASYLGTMGVEATVVSGFRMEGRVILQGHFATRVGDLVYDVTYRQFYPAAPVPLITPYADWRADWRTL